LHKHSLLKFLEWQAVNRDARCASDRLLTDRDAHASHTYH